MKVFLFSRAALAAAVLLVLAAVTLEIRATLHESELALANLARAGYTEVVLTGPYACGFFQHGVTFRARQLNGAQAEGRLCQSARGFRMNVVGP